MTEKMFFGRTAPDPSPRARSWLKDRAETLSARARRVKPLHTCFEWSRMLDAFTQLDYICGPLPPIRLADGTRPYGGEPGDEKTHYNGTLPLDGPADPRLLVLWREALARRPQLASLHLSLRPPEMVREALCQLDVHNNEHKASVEAKFTYWERDEEPDGIERLAAAMGLEGFPGAFELYRRGKRMPGQSRERTWPDLPADPDLPLLLTGALERLGWVAAPVVGSIDFLIVDGEEGYTAMRPRLLEIARGWDASVSGLYRPGFDPFLTPPVPPPGEAYRFPVARYDRAGNESERPTILLNIAHSTEGAFLEFFSSESKARLRKYAELADIEASDLQIWDGRPEDRWGT